MSQKTQELFRFGPFRLDLRERSLFQGGQRVRLTPKAFDLVALLVEHRGGLVSREEIVQALWPDTFVEDSNLTYQMSTLRKALEAGGGEALIETVPKRGYRLTVPVVVETAVANESRRQWYIHWAVVTLAIAAVATGIGLWLAHESSATLGSPRVSPLTSYPGSELDPSLSPDGSQVAFIWNNGSGAEFHVYTQAVGASAPRRLSSGAMNEASPVWSPDGRHIAFLRELSASRSAIIIASSSGGAERKLAEIRCGIPRPDRNIENWYGTFLDWHPNGQWLAASEYNPNGSSASESQGILLISTSDGTTRQLTTPTPPAADIAPAFRGDGRYLVFVHRTSYGASQLYGINLTSESQPSGQPSLVSSESVVNASPKWTLQDEVLFLVGPALVPELRLWRIAPPRSNASAVPFLTDAVLEISGVRTSRQHGGMSFSYVRANRDENIWELRPRQNKDRSGTPAVPLIDSSRADVAPEFSPDGKRLAWVSDRSGTMEIWVSAPDGSNPIQVTKFGGPEVGGPNWSPDANFIASACRDLSGQSSTLYLIKPDGGGVEPITAGDSLDVVPTWSNDSQFIYFTSSRSGSQALWKRTLHGGSATRISNGPEWLARESPDGRWLYSIRRSSPARFDLVKRSLRGASSDEILAPVANTRSYAIANDGVYFISPPQEGDQGRIEFLRNDGRRATVTTLLKPPGFGITVSPTAAGGERRILYTQTDRFETDLLLVEGFR
jgi:Tol biopolymer transport system component/DNA-binding winged helix-turn-helix (wHTH) protein